MSPLILRAHLTHVITYGLVVVCCVPASAASQAFGVGDLGTLGQTYSFSMDPDPPDNPLGHAFAASQAVEHTTLTRTSGGGFAVGAFGSGRGLVIGVDGSERGVGYVYRAHGAVEQATIFSTADGVDTGTGTPAGAYSHTRDADNHLWWAVPSRHRHH